MDNSWKEKEREDLFKFWLFVAFWILLLGGLMYFCYLISTHITITLG